MKRLFIFLACFSCALLQAKLRIRQKHPQWAPRHLSCCADQRGQIVSYGAGSAEDAVNILREEVIKAYDAGTYAADWGKKRRAALEIQSHLGYTVPEDYSFNDE